MGPRWRLGELAQHQPSKERKPSLLCRLRVSVCGHQEPLDDPGPLRGGRTIRGGLSTCRAAAVLTPTMEDSGDLGASQIHIQ